VAQLQFIVVAALEERFIHVGELKKREVWTENPALKGSLRNQKWYLKTILKVLWDTFIGSLKNYLRKWFFKEPCFEKVLSETKNGALKNHFEGSMTPLHRFYEELFKEMVL